MKKKEETVSCERWMTEWRIALRAVDASGRESGCFFADCCFVFAVCCLLFSAQGIGSVVWRVEWCGVMVYDLWFVI
jgi:hypothetical protein